MNGIQVSDRSILLEDDSHVNIGRIVKDENDLWQFKGYKNHEFTCEELSIVDNFVENLNVIGLSPMPVVKMTTDDFKWVFREDES